MRLAEQVRHQNFHRNSRRCDCTPVVGLPTRADNQLVGMWFQFDSITPSAQPRSRSATPTRRTVRRVDDFIRPNGALLHSLQRWGPTQPSLRLYPHLEGSVDFHVGGAYCCGGRACFARRRGALVVGQRFFDFFRRHPSRHRRRSGMSPPVPTLAQLRVHHQRAPPPLALRERG